MSLPPKKNPNPPHGTAQECDGCDRQLPSYEQSDLWNKGWKRAGDRWFCAECVEKFVGEGLE